MKKFAKLLAMVLAVSMVLTMFVGAYNDNAAIDEDKADAVEAVYNAGVMMGDDKGNFNPTANLKRSEMAKILFALQSKDQTAGSVYALLADEFADSDENPGWAKNYIGYAAAKGIVVGDNNNEFNADDNLSYVEAAIVLLRTLNLEGTYEVGEDEYDDFTGPKWFTNAVIAADDAGLLADLEIEDFKAPITREDVAVMIDNAIAKNKALNTENATKYPLYALAAPFSGIVTGEGENAKEEAVILFDGDEEGTVLMGDLELEDIIGKEITAVVEDNKIISELVISGDVYNTYIGNIEKVADEDDVDEDDNKTETLLMIDDKVAAYVTDNLSGNSSYYFYNGIESVVKGNFTNTYNNITAAQDANMDVQPVTIIVNSNSFSVFYNPVFFTLFNTDETYEKYDSTKKEWTGEWYYDIDADDATTADLAISADYAELEKNTLVAAQIVDGEFVIVGFPYTVNADELTATSKKGAYTFKLDGEEMLNVSGVTGLFNGISGMSISDVNLWKAISLADADAPDTVYVYENLIIGFEAYEAEEETHAYAIFTSYEVEFVVNEDDGTKLDYTITIDAIVDGEETEIVYEVTELATADVPAFTTDKVLYKVTYGAETTIAAVEKVNIVKSAVVALDDEEITIGSTTIDVDDVDAFVDATGAELELANLEVSNEGKTVKVDGKRIGAGDCVFALTIENGDGTGDDYVLVIFDTELKGGAYEKLIAELA